MQLTAFFMRTAFIILDSHKRGIGSMMLKSEFVKKGVRGLAIMAKILDQGKEANLMLNRCDARIVLSINTQG